MSVLKMAAWLRGYVAIRAEGLFLERFLNICIRRSIFLREVKRQGESSLVAYIGIDDFLRIRSVAKKTRTKVTLVNRFGLPFLIRRYRKRKTAVLGVLLFFTIIWYLSSHVIGIEIVGNERITDAEIMEKLKSTGVYFGARVKDLDRQLVKNRMMTRLSDAAWVGVNIKGSKVYIEIRERIDTKIELDKDMPCNVVAAKDGIIDLMKVTEGQSMVKKGEMVEKGDLLVSGAMDSTAKGIRYLHADGEIFAITNYKASGEYELTYKEKIYTGNETIRRHFEFGTGKIPLYINEKIPYENCDKETKTVKYGEKFHIIPTLYLVTDTYREYTVSEKKRSLEETVEAGRKALETVLLEQIPKNAEIKNNNVVYLPLSDGKVMVTLEYECRENIALQTPIDKIEFLDYDIEGE